MATDLKSTPPASPTVSTSKPDFNLEKTYGKAEMLVEKNKKTLSIIVGAVALLVGGYFAYTKLIIAPQDKEAQTQMYMAEKYFEKDSLKKAVNGDGNFLGFKQIIENYGQTQSANLSHYYLGLSYLKMGQYEAAIESLEKFSGNDDVIMPIAQGAIGDAYAELNQNEKAVNHYLKASKMAENKFISPIYLMKAGLSYETLNKYADAAEVYNQIKRDYSDTNEGRDADKYIARAKAMVK
jgi:tetratricopeptide (TPR) repeat protein